MVAWQAEEHLHVLLQLPSTLQVVHVALDGHVVQAQQVVESDAMALPQLLLVCTLQCMQSSP